MGEEDVPGEGRKTRRLQNACDSCRRRKVRCDSANRPGGVCSNCASLGVQCTHTATRKKRGPKIGAPSNTAVKAKVSAILSESSSATFHIPEDQESVREILVELAKYARYLEKELARARREDHFVPEFQLSPMVNAESKSSPSNDSDSDSSYSETEVLSKRVADMSISRLQNRHFGKSSTILFVTSALLGQHRTKPDFLGRRPEFWAPSAYELEIMYQEQRPPYEFPSDDLLRDLIDLYFTCHHPYYPLLHRATFEQSVSQSLHLRDYEFGSVVIALCSVASRYSDDPRNLPESSSSTLALGWRWFRQLKLVKSSFVAPTTLYELQAYCLSIHFLQTTNLTDSGWILTGLSIRFAQERGVHRRSDPTDKRSLERELWKRAFWQLVAQDLLVGIALGRPRAITTDEYDTEALIECDESEWEESNNELPLKTFQGSISIFWNCYMRLLEVAAFCQRSLYSVRSSEFKGTMGISDSQWNERAVREIDSALNEWIESVPSHLKWDPHSTNNVVLTQSAMLYSVYYWTQIQAHRTFIPKPGEKSNVNFPSLAICLNAARSCVHVVDVQHKRHHFPISPIIPPLFSSAVMILLSIFRAKELKLQIDSQKEMVNVYKCIEIFREWEKKIKVAGRFSDLLGALISGGNLKLPFETPNPSRTLKRGREIESTAPASTTNPNLEASEGTPSDSDRSFQTVENQYGDFNKHVVTDWHSLNLPDATQAADIGNSFDPLLANYHQHLSFTPSSYDEGANHAEMPFAGTNQQDWDMFLANLDQFFGWSAF